MSLETGSLRELRRLERLVRNFSPQRDAISIGGKIVGLGSGFYNIAGLARHVAIGDILVASGSETPVAEVTSLSESEVVAFPFDPQARLRIGETVFRRGPLSVAPTAYWLGRTVNALGEPVDGLGPLRKGAHVRRVHAGAPPALRRRLVKTGIQTGVKAIDVFAPLCAGQRLGIFAGSGVGKSTMLTMIASAVAFDVAVIGLVGERGREVREFVEHTLGRSREKSVVVVATGDETALLRRTAAQTAMAVAEYFKDQGRSVLLILDSLTRFALACREIAIASGEPAVSRGFPPSVFADLPRLLERAGPGQEGEGAITAVFAVLVDGDDHNDPVADAVRGIVDGHLVLDRSIATQGRFPAIDIPASLSRLAHVALPAERQIFAARLRALISRFEESRDLRALGGYHAGADPELDAAVAIVPQIYSWLSQSAGDPPCDDPFKSLADALQPAATAENSP